MNKFLGTVIFFVVLLFDQFTKYFAVLHLRLGEQRPIIPGFFDLTLVYNPGAAFGMFGNMSDTSRRVALTAVTVIALLVIARLAITEGKNDAWIGCGLSGILGGAVGNLIDRFRYTGVVDFLDFYIQRYHWPAFNVADTVISVGVFLVIIRMLVGEVVVQQSDEQSDEKGPIDREDAVS